MQFRILQSELLLPWFVNGTLGQADREIVLNELEVSPHLCIEADWLVCVMRQLRSSVKGSESRHFGDDQRLKLLMKMTKQASASD